MSDVEVGATLASRTPSGRDCLQWRSRGQMQMHAADREVVRIPIIDGDPIRQGGQWQNRLNRHGLYFWQTTGTHVWYESALEASCLAVLDQSGDVQRICAQPFRLLFRTESEQVWHDPDFFAIHYNGDQVVYDVKPSARMNHRTQVQFNETARVCEAVGWRHVVLNEPAPVLSLNLKFLASSRHLRCHPPAEIVERIHDVFVGGRTVQEGREMINRRFPALAMPFIRHLLWHRTLITDLTARLDFDSILTTASASEEKSCCM
ncbi:TnsA-like heteromeric transposase endonuclease subunit [Gordonia iterans]